MANLPSTKQMLNRINDGHVKYLRAVRDQADAVGPTANLGTIRGMQTVARTLSKWQVVETRNVGMGQYETTLTDRGAELLSAIEDRHANRADPAWQAARDELDRRHGIIRGRTD